MLPTSQSNLLLVMLTLILAAASATRVLYSCPDGQFWNGQRCLPCQQLASSSNTGYCKCSAFQTCDSFVCYNGFYPVEGSTKSCQQGCDANCNQCGLGPDAEYCYSCAHTPTQSFQLIGNICMPVLTSSGCAKFNSLTGECNECQAGYYKQSQSLDLTSALFTSAGTSTVDSDVCQQCSITNCGQCDSEKTCKQCIDGYMLVVSENLPPSCISCEDPNCQECPSSLQTCKVCAVGYFTTVYGSCSSCQSISINCAACQDAQTCLKCRYGYFVNQFNSCQQCPKQCAQCTDSNTCTICSPGVMMRNNKCITCPAGCSNCLVSDAGLTSCTACSDGYFMQDGSTCLRCSNYLDSQALRCAGPLDDPKMSTPQVTQCQFGTGTLPMFLTKKSDGTPVCVNDLTKYTNCLTISQGDSSNNYVCASCFPGLYLLASGTCSGCPSNCSTCQLSSDKTILECLTCIPYFYVAASKECTRCSVSDGSQQIGCTTCPNNVCTACADNYVLSSGNCLACISGCKTCLADTYQTACSVCQNGYFKSTTNTCVQCLSDCATCAYPGNVCLTCPLNSAKLGTGCSSILQKNCVTPGDNNLCKICDYGYYLSNGKCLKCISPDSGFVCRANSRMPQKELDISVTAALLLFVIPVILTAF